MTDVVCTWCPRRCKLGTLASFEPPKDMLIVVPGVTAAGVEMSDIRPYCEREYIKPMEE